MELKVDNREHGERELAFLRAFIADLHAATKALSLLPIERKGLLTRVAYNLAASLAGTGREMGEGPVTYPRLVFARDEREQELIASSDGSSMTDYVTGFVDELR